jgi:hypothetical protein
MRRRSAAFGRLRYIDMPKLFVAIALPDATACELARLRPLPMTGIRLLHEVEKHISLGITFALQGKAQLSHDENRSRILDQQARQSRRFDHVLHIDSAVELNAQFLFTLLHGTKMPVLDVLKLLELSREIQLLSP